MADTQSEVQDLQLTRNFSASPERVFAAWTQPEHLKGWWAASPDMSTSLAEVDLRVGGAYRLGMLNKKTQDEHIVVGEFREVVENKKISYTWAWEKSMDGQGHESLVTVEFRADGNGTELVLTHAQLPDQDSCEKHQKGWTGCLANLESLLDQ